MVYYWLEEKNEKWEIDMEIFRNYELMRQEGDIIHRKNIYYPRLNETKKRGRHAFIELYKKLCLCEKDKTRYMDIDKFELIICKQKDYKVHIQTTKKYGDNIETMWILETDISDNVTNYMNQYEYIQTPDMPYEEKEQDKVYAISSLIDNLKPNKKEIIKLLGFLVEELEQLS
jgi:hypothetical protein